MLLEKENALWTEFRPLSARLLVTMTAGRARDQRKEWSRTHLFFLFMSPWKGS